MKVAITTIDDLLVRFPEKKIENADLSGMNYKDEVLDFAGYEFNGVEFGKTSDVLPKQVANINFKGAKLNDVSFTNVHLNNCDFDTEKTRLKMVSFSRSKIMNCRFRQASLDTCDFRYSDVDNTTFQEARLQYCDFYRCHFTGINIFRSMLMDMCSINYTFYDNSCITKENFSKKKPLVQEHLDEFTVFVTRANKNRNSLNAENPHDIEILVDNRYIEASQIYRQLSSIWDSKGYFRDAGWAYRMAKRNERSHIMRHYKNRPIMYTFKIVGSYIADFTTGFGESLWNVFFTYLGLLLIGGIVYRFFFNYTDSFNLTVTSMFGLAIRDIKPENNFIAIFSILQTTFGIILTGIFGFVLANKIRRS